MLQKPAKLLLATSLSFALINSVEIHSPNSQSAGLNLNPEAYARSSGGRSGGGSFRRSAPSRPSYPGGGSNPRDSNNPR